MHNGQEDYDLYDEFGWEPSFGPFPWDGGTDDWDYHPKMEHLFEGHEDVRSRWSHTFGRLSEIPEWGSGPGGDPPGYEGWRLYGEPFSYDGPDDRDLLPDERSANWAAERLRREHDSPFLVAVGFNRPHAPLYAPDEYFDRFPLDELELPGEQSWPSDVPDIAAEIYGYGRERFRILDDAGGDDLRKQWLQAYLACVAFVDDQLGTVLDALEDGPNADDTVVVFTSDNGFHMGEKGMLYKKTLYDEATRVPLLVSGPGVLALARCSSRRRIAEQRLGKPVRGPFRSWTCIQRSSIAVTCRRGPIAVARSIRWTARASVRSSETPRRRGAGPSTPSRPSNRPGSRSNADGTIRSRRSAKHSLPSAATATGSTGSKTDRGSCSTTRTTPTNAKISSVTTSPRPKGRTTSGTSSGYSSG